MSEKDWPDMDVRVMEAQRRISEGLGPRRIPAHWGDVDLVLGDLHRENKALRERAEKLADQVKSLGGIPCA